MTRKSFILDLIAVIISEIFPRLDLTPQPPLQSGEGERLSLLFVATKIQNSDNSREQSPSTTQNSNHREFFAPLSC